MFRWALFVCVLVLTPCARTIAQSAPKAPGPVGTWEIKGADMGGTQWTGAMVLTMADKGAIVGHIDWSGSGGKYDGASGREHVRATYDSATRALKVKGERLERANKIGLGAYSAELSEDGARLEKGKWSDEDTTGKWAAKRTETGAKAPASVVAEKTGFVEHVYTGPNGGKFKYVVFIPHDYKKDGDKTYPVILFLHGVGENGTDGWAPTKVGIGPMVQANEKTFPFIVAFPQSRSDKLGNANEQKRAAAILDEVLKSYKGDPKRVYVTGLSAGGASTWDMAVAYPDRWAAIAPVCCAGSVPEEAARIKHIPCWCFHGAKDQAAPIKLSRMMIKALEAAGGKPRFTIDPEGAHTVEYFDSVYKNQDLYKWLLTCALPASSAAQGPDGEPVWEVFISAKKDRLPYRMLAPAHYDPKQAYPLVVFLHGAGSRGNDNERQVNEVPDFFKKSGRKDSPCFIVAPQCPGKGPLIFWTETVGTGLVSALLDDFEKNHRIDPKRIYVTGVSDGGWGTFALLARHPTRFAAGAPLCGGGDVNDAPKYAQVPIWVFHGAKDNVEPVKSSRDLVAALRKAGGNPKYTEYPNADHNIWDRAYGNPKLYEWLFAQKRD